MNFQPQWLVHDSPEHEPRTQRTINRQLTTLPFFTRRPVSPSNCQFAITSGEWNHTLSQLTHGSPRSQSPLSNTITTHSGPPATSDGIPTQPNTRSPSIRTSHRDPQTDPLPSLPQMSNHQRLTFGTSSATSREAT